MKRTVIGAYDFDLTLNVLKLHTGVVIATVIDLVCALDKFVQCQRFVSATLAASTPDVVIRRSLLELAVFTANYGDVLYSGYVDDLRVVVSIPMYCLRSLDEVYCFELAL